MPCYVHKMAIVSWPYHRGRYGEYSLTLRAAFKHTLLVASRHIASLAAAATAAIAGMHGPFNLPTVCSRVDRVIWKPIIPRLGLLGPPADRVRVTNDFIMPAAVGGGAKSDTALRPSVCPSLGYRHAGCLQPSHVRTADPSADGRRSATSRTAIGGGHIVSPPPGR